MKTSFCGHAANSKYLAAFAGICAMFSVSAAQAACSLRDVGQQFKIKQDNHIFAILNVEQHGSKLGGSASFAFDWPSTAVTGDIIKGGSSTSGANFQVIIQWKNGSRGNYVGTFDDEGKLKGKTCDEQHPPSCANWSVDDVKFACINK